MLKAIKRFFRSKVHPVLEPVLPKVLTSALVKITCAHESNNHTQAWVRLPPPGISFKLVNTLQCRECSKERRRV